MFNWLWPRPRCPIDTWEKAWTETRMCWLAEQFGLDRLRRAEVVLPNDHYFPDPYRSTAEDVRRMMDRLCGYMGIDPGTLDLVVSPDEEMSEAAGYYHPRQSPGQRATVRIAESQLHDPPALAATLAHELAHELLLGGGVLDANDLECEWITDLLPVYLGVGVFTANATIREDCGQIASRGWWTMSRQGYLPSRMFGYALALFAFMRGDFSPSWSRELRVDAASALREGLRYLRQSGDSLFHPDTIAGGRPTPSVSEAITRLQTGTPTLRLATLWDVEAKELTGPECLEAVAGSLGDEDPAVAAGAARALMVFGASAAPVLPRLRECLWAAQENLRIEVARTLGVLGLEPEATVPELCGLLKERSRPLFLAAAWALEQYGTQVDTAAVGRLLAELEMGLIECDYELIDAAARTLLAMSGDAERHVREYFAGRGAEMKRQALAALAQQRSAGDEGE
jgi:hypothetical protein